MLLVVGQVDVLQADVAVGADEVRLQLVLLQGRRQPLGLGRADDAGVEGVADEARELRSDLRGLVEDVEPVHDLHVGLPRLHRCHGEGQIHRHARSEQTVDLLNAGHAAIVTEVLQELAMASDVSSGQTLHRLDDVHTPGESRRDDNALVVILRVDDADDVEHGCSTHDPHEAKEAVDAQQLGLGGDATDGRHIRNDQDAEDQRHHAHPDACEVEKVPRVPEVPAAIDPELQEELTQEEKGEDDVGDEPANVPAHFVGGLSQYEDRVDQNDNHNGRLKAAGPHHGLQQVPLRSL
mmetsp:Transcript_67863/g.174910  ORF Transcript_67863/g.174910 Transcript_67863/m.174910 type:complete len:294 (-) Transcript_67863:139-1020(-)